MNRRSSRPIARSRSVRAALSVHVAGHRLGEVRHGDGEGVEPVVLEQGPPLAGDAGELVEQLILPGVVGRPVLRGLKVPLDEVVVDDQPGGHSRTRR
jgi:hypothetical protein